MSTFIVPTSALSKVKLNKTKTTLYVGQSTTLKLSGAKVKKWKSNDKNIAIVNKNGKRYRETLQVSQFFVFHFSQGAFGMVLKFQSNFVAHFSGTGKL